MIIFVGNKHRIIPSPGTAAHSDLMELMATLHMSCEKLLFAEIRRDAKEEKRARKDGLNYYQLELIFSPNTRILVDAPNHEIYSSLICLNLKISDKAMLKLIDSENLRYTFYGKGIKF